MLRAHIANLRRKIEPAERRRHRPPLHPDRSAGSVTGSRREFGCGIPHGRRDNPYDASQQSVATSHEQAGDGQRIVHVSSAIEHAHDEPSVEPGSARHGAAASMTATRAGRQTLGRQRRTKVDGATDRDGRHRRARNRRRSGTSTRPRTSSATGRSRPAPRTDGDGPSAAIRAAADDERDVVAHAGRLVLALGALGIVYGDIGTSPLYTEQFIFTAHANAAHPTIAGVYGIASLIFWALMIEVSIKYAGFIMRAHNRGDGGIMALTALIQRKQVGRTAVLVTLGIFGAGLFFGDGMITPAISVTSAVEGLNVVSPSLSHLVVPISLGDPDRPVRRPAVRDRRGRLAVRPGDPGVLHRHRRLRAARDRAAPGRPPGPLAGLGRAVHDRPRGRRLADARRRRAVLHRAPRRCTPTAATSAPRRSA